MTCLRSRIMRFINNEYNKNKKEFLFNIIENISWYNKKIINDYLVSTIENKNLYSSYYLYYDNKNNFSGSTQSFLSILANEGIIEQNQIIELRNLKDEVIDNCEKIVILDDYIGSGEKVITFIDTIEKYIINGEVIILCYVCQKNAIEKILNYTKSLNNKYELIFFKEAAKYNEIIEDNDVIAYINSVCSCCQDTFSFGKNDTGAMVAIGGISPNNNISLIWHNNIKYNNQRWIPLLNRNLTIEALAMKSRNIIRKGTIIWVAEYKNSIYSKKIKQDDFELLLLIFNCFVTIEEIVQFGYYDTVEQVNKKLDSLIKNGFVVAQNGYIIITNQSLIKELDRITKKLYKNVVTKKVNKEIMSNGKEMSEEQLVNIYGINVE